MNKYWENENPIEVKTSKNILRYFKQAGKLQISNPDWEDDSGNVKRGKTVTLDIFSLKEELAAHSMLKDIISTLEG